MEVKSSDIYWGAMPWVVMQLILVAIVIVWPESVTYWLGGDVQVDPAALDQKLRSIELAPGFDALPPMELMPPPAPR